VIRGRLGRPRPIRLARFAIVIETSIEPGLVFVTRWRWTCLACAHEHVTEIDTLTTGLLRQLAAHTLEHQQGLHPNQADWEAAARSEPAPPRPHRGGRSRAGGSS
jgi:hypothetical protein